MLLVTDDNTRLYQLTALSTVSSEVVDWFGDRAADPLCCDCCRGSPARPGSKSCELGTHVPYRNSCTHVPRTVSIRSLKSDQAAMVVWSVAEWLDGPIVTRWAVDVIDHQLDQHVSFMAGWQGYFFGNKNTPAGVHLCTLVCVNISRSPRYTIPAAKSHLHWLATSQLLPIKSSSMAGDMDTFAVTSWPLNGRARRGGNYKITYVHSRRLVRTIVSCYYLLTNGFVFRCKNWKLHYFYFLRFHIGALHYRGIIFTELCLMISL